MIPKTTKQLWQKLHFQGWLRYHPPISFVMENYSALEKQRDELLAALQAERDWKTDKERSRAADLRHEALMKYGRP